MANYRTTYRLSAAPLGVGGQAEVFQAEHRLTGDVLALKRRNGGGAVAGDRMRREVKVQSAIQHPNIMPIADFDGDDYEWFTMPLAALSMDHLQLPIGPDVLKPILRDAALGLQAAHASGFVHRDIKPSNILKLSDTDGERWVVADWGLVRRPEGQTTAQHTRVGAMLGTEGFAPPEVGTEIPAVPGISNHLLSAAKSGDTAAGLEVLRAAHAYADDGAFFIDELAEVSGPGLDEYVRADPDGAKELLLRMEHHLEHEPWGRRNFDHYNVPLHWIQRLAQAAGNANLLDLLEDASAALFRHDPQLDRFLQTKRSRQWIASLAPRARCLVRPRERPDRLRSELHALLLQASASPEPGRNSGRNPCART